MGDRSSELVTYLPASVVRTYAADPALTVPWCKPIEGTMVMADLSGFTAISERLAKLGDEGAERLTTVINSFFERMLKTTSRYGGDTLTFGGDAILLLFQGEQHADRGVAAALGMLKQVERAAAVDAGDAKVKIGMSVGGHSDTFLLAAAGIQETGVRALFLGRGAELTALAEAQAGRGQVAVSALTKKQLRVPMRSARTGDYWRIAEFRASAVPHVHRDERILSDAQAARLAPFLPPYVDEPSVGSANPQLTPEHRRVAVAFVNVLGLNDLIERAGSEAALEQLQSYVANLILLSEKHRGFVVSSDIATTGSKLILTFGAPIAHEYAAANAARFALDLNAWLHDAKLDVEHRIGVNGGHVFAGEVGPAFRRQYTVMGDAVNLAARLMAAAPPGEVYVSRDLLNNAGPFLCGRELPPMKVKGKEQPVAVCVLEEEKRPDHHVPIAARTHRGRSRLFGRLGELALLSERWHEALDHHCSAILVEGDAGVGKTRLVEEVVRGLGDGVRITHAACFEHLQAAPFAPWVDVLEAVFELVPEGSVDHRTAQVETYLHDRLPDFVEFGPLLNPLLNLSIKQTQVVGSLDAQSRRERLFDLVVRVLADSGQAAGHMLVLEDMHWVDESSLALVGHIAEHLGEAKVLLLLTSRPSELLDQLGDLVTRVLLAELSETESLGMVRDALDVKDLSPEVGAAVYAKTKGNPLFLEEVVHSLQSPGVLERILSASSVSRAAELAALEIPDRVQGLLMSRIDRLPADTREVLKAGSVVGRSFDAEVLGAIGDHLLAPISLDRAFEELVDSTLVLPHAEAGSAAVTFRHALVQDVAYESLPFSRRRELHGRVAEYLETAPAPSDHGVLVHHYRHADNAEKTRLHAVRASESSVAVYAGLEAIDYIDVAVTTLKGGRTTRDSCLRSRFEELKGDSLQTLSRTREAIDCYMQARSRWASHKVRAVSDDVLRDLAPIDDPDARDSLLSWKIAVALERGRSAYRRSLRWVAKGSATLPPERPALAAQLLFTKSAMLFHLGRHREAADIAREGLVLARESRDQSIQAYGLNSLGCALTGLGLFESSIDCYRECAELYEQAGELRDQAMAHSNLGYNYFYLGDLRSSMEHAELSLGLYARLGNMSGVANQHMNIGGLLSEMGQFGEGARHLGEVIKLRDHQGVQPAVVGFSLIFLARNRVMAGDIDAAEQALAEGAKVLESLGSQDVLPDLCIAQCELHLARGELDEAEDFCTRALSIARSMGAQQAEVEVLCALGRVKLAQGDAKGAIPGLEACAALAEKTGAIYERAQAMSQLAEAKAACDDGDAACEDLLTEAIRVFDRMGAGYDLKKALELRERLAAEPSVRPAYAPGRLGR